MKEVKEKKQKVVGTEDYQFEIETELGLDLVGKEFEMQQVGSLIEFEAGESKEPGLSFCRQKVEWKEEAFVLQDEVELEDQRDFVRQKRLVEK